MPSMLQVSPRFQHLHGESGGSGAIDDRGRIEASARHAGVLLLRGWCECIGLETLRLMFDCRKCVPLTVDINILVPSKLRAAAGTPAKCRRQVTAATLSLH
jgi:hypothetical protein